MRADCPMPLALGKASGEKFVTFFRLHTQTCATQGCSGNPGQDKLTNMLKYSPLQPLLFYYSFGMSPVPAAKWPEENFHFLRCRYIGVNADTEAGKGPSFLNFGPSPIRRGSMRLIGEIYYDLS
jgi:hypothetical protein